MFLTSHTNNYYISFAILLKTFEINHIFIRGEYFKGPKKYSLYFYHCSPKSILKLLKAQN